MPSVTVAAQHQLLLLGCTMVHLSPPLLLRTMKKASLPVASKCTDHSKGDVECAPAGYADQVVDVNRAAFIIR